MQEVMSDPSKAAIFEKNVNLIRLVNLSQKLGELEYTYGVSAMDALYETFDTFEFTSMLNEKTWNKFCATFAGLQVK